MLRCCRLGLSMEDLEHITVGMVFDMFIEADNDNYKWEQLATAEDIDNF